MTEVYIDQQRVFFKENTSLKLTIENTFFGNTGSYTLDVTFPLDIEENRKAFGYVNRLDVSKKYKKYDAMIVVDSKMVFKGSAKITNISDSEVKLQLLSGNSNVKFWTKAQKIYIDELEYEYTDTKESFDNFVGLDGFGFRPIIVAGSFPGKKGIFCYVPILDENEGRDETGMSNGLLNEHMLMVDKYDPYGEPVYIEVARDCICPNLMFVFKWIAKYLGYRIRRNDRDNPLVNGIYIATATRTTKNEWRDSSEEKAMAKALPHWTVEEFVKQLQNFLNVTIIFDDINGTVDIVSDTFTEGTIDITDSVEEEYEVEVIDDEDVESNLYDSNVVYKEGSSDYHGIDMVNREIIDSFTEIKCTYEEFLRQWDSMTADERKITIWTTERGQYCSDGNGEKKRFNHFGGIIRNRQNDNDIELKISPVATTRDIEMYAFDYSYGGGNTIYKNAFERKGTCPQTVLCLQNQYEPANKQTVWDAIQGENEEGNKKEDIMQVFLMDGLAVPSGFYGGLYQIPFTHYSYNCAYDPTNVIYNHCKWSLSLANDNALMNIGILHESARLQNRNAVYSIVFIAEHIPSVYYVFMIRNKRYTCKKIEVQFDANGMDKKIRGYFEEIL